MESLKDYKPNGKTLSLYIIENMLYMVEINPENGQYLIQANVYFGSSYRSFPGQWNGVVWKNDLGLWSQSF